MKIKPFKLLGQLLVGAAPVAAGVFLTPAAGVAVGGLMGTLGLTKKAGQEIEKKGITVGPARLSLPPGIVLTKQASRLSRSFCRPYWRRTCRLNCWNW